MYAFKLARLFLAVLFSFFCFSNLAFAEQPHYLQFVEIHQITHYPDRVDVHTSYETHIVSTEAFMENHKDLTLIKQANKNLYVVKTDSTVSPLSSILSVLGIKGEEILNIEKATIWPVGQTPPFIQFEIKTFKA